MRRILCLLALVAAAAAAEPSPPVWPEVFSAQLFQNRTGRLAITTLWYDWPGGRNFNFIHEQQGELTFDIEWTNGTSYYWKLQAGTCKEVSMPVGILTPDWLANATFLGKETVDFKETYKWAKADFITYWSDVRSGDPVRWRFFDGAQFEVMVFSPGTRLPEALWQAPPICFADGTPAQAQELATSKLQALEAASRAMPASHAIL